MNPSFTNMLTFGMFLWLAKYIDLQKLTLCQTPEINTICILECETRDFNHPVTFAHPRTRDVGSCVTQDKCNSHKSYYTLSQNTLNGFITRFYIDKLNRKRDQGDWACTYGNYASNIMNLTVHSRPLSVDVEVEPKSFKVLEIRCVCSCVYPVNSVEIRVTISNQEKLGTVKRKLRNLKSTNASKSRCTKEEDGHTVFGSMETDQDNWPGRSIDIECFCENSIIGHIITKKMTYIFEGAPEKPSNFELIKASSDYLEIKWNKGSNGGFKQSFIIQYTSTDGSLASFTKKDDGKTTEFSMKLTGLTPSTSYKLWIYAENEKGKSRKVGLNCTTEEEIITSTYIPTYIKMIIPLICCGFGSIIFTAVTYYCIFYTFERISSTDAHIYRDLKVFKWNMYVYRKQRMIKYVIFWLLVLVVSYVAAFTLRTEHYFVTWIILISLGLGVVMALIANAVVWSFFIIDYIAYQRHLNANPQSQEEKIGLGQKTRILIANSKTIIEDRVNDGTFVKTKGYLEGWKKSLQYGVVMYTGAFGDGRTTNSYHIMNKWVKDFDYTPIILNQLTKFDKMITANDKFVIFIKGAVCNVIKNKMVEEEIALYLPMLMAWVKAGRTKVIMTSQTKTLHDHRLQFQNIELFDGKYHIDLSDKKYELTKLEKELILRKHCKVNNIEIYDETIEEDKTPNTGNAEGIDNTGSQTVSRYSGLTTGERNEKITKYTKEKKQNKKSKDETKTEIMDTGKQSLSKRKRASEKKTVVEEDINKIEICEEKIEKPVGEGAKEKIKTKKAKKRSFPLQSFRHEKEGTLSTEQDVTAETQRLLNESLQTEQDIPAPEKSIRISEQLVSEIIETEPRIGYPESCAMFCENKTYTQMGLEFFLQPSEKIIEEIDRLRSSNNKDKSHQYEMLQTLFKENGKVRFDKHPTKLLASLNGLYITQDEDKDYIFIHNSVYVAVGLSMAKTDPNTVLQKCNWNFLRHHTKLKGKEYNKELTYLIITPEQLEIIKTRFFIDLSHDSVNRRCDYISKLGTAFLQSTLDEILNNEKLNMILRESCTRERGVFVHACKQENRALAEELWNRYKQYIPKNLLDYCLRRVKDKSLEALLNQWLNLDVSE